MWEGRAVGRVVNMASVVLQNAKGRKTCWYADTWKAQQVHDGTQGLLSFIHEVALEQIHGEQCGCKDGVDRNSLPVHGEHQKGCVVGSRAWACFRLPTNVSASLGR